MNVYFFQCQDMFDKIVYLPYASGALWAYANQNPYINENFYLRDIFFEKLPVDQYLEKIESPSVVFFSTYNWNTEYHLSMAKSLKQKYPDVLTIFGGPNIQQTMEWHQSNPQVDITVWGEGEIAVERILLAKLNKTSFDTIPGISMLHHNQLIANTVSPRNRDDNNYPSPYLAGIFDDFFERYPYEFNVILETNRGCPYSCTFCDIGADYYSKIKVFPLDRVYQEIDWFAKNKVSYVEITDSNFGILPRDLEIAKYFRQSFLHKGFPEKVKATWAKNNPDRVTDMSLILEEMNRSGITLALQSSNESTLVNVKRVNIANSKLKSIVDFYKQKNIMTYHEFVLGLPGETKQSWINGLSEIVDINPDGYIYGHWAEAYANTELMDPIYIESFQIKVKRLPVVSFWTCSDDNMTKEFGWYVTETYSMVESEYKDCFVFLKFLVAVHSLGWARSIGETTARHYDIKLSDFYKTFYQWCLDNQQSLLGQHMQQIKSHLEIVFSGQQGWGQTIFGNNDIRWDYCSWLGIVIERNRFMFFQDLQKFLEQYYNQLDINTLITASNKEIIECSPDQDFKKFCINRYWFNRKTKKWKV